MKLTRNQSLILWALLSEGGGALAGKLKPELKKPDRDALTKAGLIGSERRGRANWVSVTDSGWSRIASLELPDLSERSAAGAVLQTLIGRLKAYSHISGVALADILAPAEPPVEPQRPGRDDALHDRIRRAYLEVTGGRFNERALLSKLRARLSDLPRSDLDAALIVMNRDDERASLMPLDNPRERTRDEQDAAVDLGGQPAHLLWITK